MVQGTDNYGPENELITRCLQKFPMNTDSDVVAMKVGLIDITNSPTYHSIIVKSVWLSWLIL